MFLDNAVSDCQPQACAARLAFSRAAFSGEKWIVNFVDMFRSNAGAAIADIDLNGVSVAGANAERAVFAGHGVFRIQKKIQKYLLQFSGIAVDRREIFIELGINLYARGLELMVQQRQRFFDDLVEINLAELSSAGAGEVQ